MSVAFRGTGAAIRKNIIRFGAKTSVSALALVVAACVGAPPPRPQTGAVMPPPQASTQPTSGGIYKVGNPYQVANIWYYPREQPDYDETGIGSWYGTEFHGRLTANGEIFDRTAITAAHPTLPMPANVRVTNLENGLSVIVRVNDRGPFKNGRIIDLSEGAADKLGYRLTGTARVRVTYLGPAPLNGVTRDEPAPEIARAVTSAPTPPVTIAELPPISGVPSAPRPNESVVGGRPVATGYTIPEPEPLGAVTHVPVPSMTSIYVQAGAFASAENANRVAGRLSGTGARVSKTMIAGKPFFRVRIGPFQNIDDADAALNQVVARGHNEAAIVVE